ncbi:N-acetyltransferase [Flavobacteriaceae bacterium]|nr:N-acetyltransferase [Flavobacteriaceae bacterium]
MERNRLNTAHFIHPTSIVDEKSKIGSGVKIWHFSHIMKDVIIGNNTIIGQNSFIASNVKIGNNCKIQNNVSLYDGVVCQDDVFIGPSAVFTNVINPRSFIERKDEFKSTIIHKGSSIGANSTIICGNNIGQYALVGAGSVVNRDILDFEVVVGNPCRNIGWISIEGEKIVFDSNGFAISNGKKYCLKNNKCFLI